MMPATPVSSDSALSFISHPSSLALSAAPDVSVPAAQTPRFEEALQSARDDNAPPRRDARQDGKKDAKQEPAAPRAERREAEPRPQAANDDARVDPATEDDAEDAAVRDRLKAMRGVAEAWLGALLVSGAPVQAADAPPVSLAGAAQAAGEALASGSAGDVAALLQRALTLLDRIEAALDGAPGDASLRDFLALLRQDALAAASPAAAPSDAAGTETAENAFAALLRQTGVADAEWLNALRRLVPPVPLPPRDAEAPQAAAPLLSPFAASARAQKESGLQKAPEAADHVAAPHALAAAANRANSEAAMDESADASHSKDAAPLPSFGAQAQAGGHGQGQSSDQSQREAPQPGALPPAFTALTPARAQEPSAFAKLMEQARQPAAASPAEQMVAQVKAASAAGQSRIQIQLHPEEMGRLDIRLEVSAEGKANLHITADNVKAYEALRNDARLLERMLTDVGLKTDSGSLNFNLNTHQQPGSQQEQRQGGSYRGKTLAALDEALAAAPLQTYLIAPEEEADGVDIRI